ncbi:MAG TPA: DsbA family oxidoreductase [Burkholderiales bacterium]|nr:DsbA family oxidoreductase [Burkholderiales bacterium]
MPLAIDIVSDVVCPWCYVGKRRLERALELYRARRPDAPAPEVVYHPFQLNPDVPREGVPRAEYIEKKFGPRGYGAHERLVHAGRPLGIDFAFDRIERQPNTLAAHALIEWARRRGVQPAMKEALMKAFFVDGRDLADARTLVAVAAEAGLERGEAETAIADEELLKHVAEEEEHAKAMGIHGVPFFILNRRLAVEGAQPSDVLLEAMLEAEKQPAEAK